MKAPAPGAVAYLRVSTDEQANNGHGLDVQRDTILEWSARAGVPVVEWCVDAGKSGSNGLDTRDGLADAVGHIAEGRASELVVYRLDRLARDLVVQELVLAEVVRKRGRVRSCDPAEDQVIEAGDDDPTRVLIRQIMGALAEWERAMIRLRLRAGRRRKMAGGGYGGGQVGYGLTVTAGGRVVLDDETAGVVERIVARRAGQAGYEIIAAELNRDGVPGPHGGRWHANTVRRAYLRWARVRARAGDAGEVVVRARRADATRTGST